MRTKATRIGATMQIASTVIDTYEKPDRTMKKQYIPPALKVVAVRMERGFQTSFFRRIDDLFMMESLDDEFRGECYSYDDWSGSGSSSDGDKYDYNDWGSM